MNRKNLFALVLAAALLVCSCGWAESGPTQTAGSIPVVQMGISPDVLNLDNSQRDAFGYDVEDVNGELFCLYNSGDGGMAYLRNDGTLLYEGSDDSGDIDCFIYTLNEQNLAVLTDGILAGLHDPQRFPRASTQRVFLR